MQQVRRLALILVTVGAAACSSTKTTTGGTGCQQNADCGPGEICEAGACAHLCSTQSDCAANLVCAQGRCAEPNAGSLPTIDSVIGNAAGDPSAITDAMVVTGSVLQDAAFELRSAAGAIALAVRTQTETSAELVFPADIRSGEYVLVATNLAGSDQAAVALTLPELTGDTLVARINSDATTTFAVARLPVGSDANSVALGNHNHDTAYYDRAEADATFVSKSASSELFEGGNYIPNPSFADALNQWQVEATGPIGTHSRIDVSADGVAGFFALENDDASRVLVTSQKRVTIDRGSAYRIIGSFRNTASAGVDGKISLGVRLWDAAGGELLNGSDWHLYAVKDVEPGSTWQRYELFFGANTAQDFPPEARTMTVAALLNNNGGNVGTQKHQVQGLGLFDVTANRPGTFRCLPPAWATTADEADSIACTATITLDRPALVVAHFSGHGHADTGGGWCMYGVAFPGEWLYYPRAPTGTRVYDDLREALHSYQTNWETVSATRSKVLPAGVHTVELRVANGGPGLCSLNGSSLNGYILPF